MDWKSRDGRSVCPFLALKRPWFLGQKPSLRAPVLGFCALRHSWWGRSRWGQRISELEGPLWISPQIGIPVTAPPSSKGPLGCLITSSDGEPPTYDNFETAFLFFFNLIFFKSPKHFVLEYNQLTMLLQFQVNSEGTWPYMKLKKVLLEMSP